MNARSLHQSVLPHQAHYFLLAIFVLLSRDLNAHVSSIDQQSSLHNQHFYLFIIADKQQPRSDHQLEERSSCDSEAEGKDGLKDSVDHQQDDPVRNPLPMRLLGVESADKWHEVMQGEDEHAQNEEDEGISLRWLGLFHHDLFWYCLHLIL